VLLAAFCILLVVHYRSKQKLKELLKRIETSTSALNQESSVTEILNLSTSDQEKNDAENLSVMSWLPDAIIVLDPELKLNWANQTAEKWFGFLLDQHQKMNVISLINQCSFIEFLKARDFKDSVDLVAPALPDVTMRLRVMPYRENHLILQARDITQVKHLEQVRRDFVANASHELRTPISIVYGYLDMMMGTDEKGISRDWKPAVKQMHDQTIRVKQIIEDMMMLSRLEDPETIEEHAFVEMAPIIESAGKNARVLSGSRNQTITTEINSNHHLHCNQKEIESLIANLVSNAVRYTPENGKISISWDVDLTGGLLRVSDNGIGIESSDIPRLTERFYRTDTARSRETGGTGLGLAIVNHIINRHQATLQIDSEPAKGSCFAVIFSHDRLRSNPKQVNLLLH